MDLCTPARTAIRVQPIRLLRIVMCNKVFRARHTHLYSDAILRSVFMREVAHGKRLSQKIQQLLNNKSLEYIFIPTCRELNSLSKYVVCGLWLHVMQVDIYKLDSGQL